MRLMHGLTQAQAAALVYATTSAWEEWEQDRRRMHPGLWHLLRIRLGVHPHYVARPTPERPTPPRTESERIAAAMARGS
ncbi:MAG: hypothetical protein ACREUG_17035 [Steroidobacteraceae bacterium]